MSTSVGDTSMNAAGKGVTGDAGVKSTWVLEQVAGALAGVTKMMPGLKRAVDCFTKSDIFKSGDVMLKKHLWALHEIILTFDNNTKETTCVADKLLILFNSLKIANLGLVKAIEILLRSEDKQKADVLKQVRRHLNLFINYISKVSEETFKNGQKDLEALKNKWMDFSKMIEAESLVDKSNQATAGYKETNKCISVVIKELESVQEKSDKIWRTIEESQSILGKCVSKAYTLMAEINDSVEVKIGYETVYENLTGMDEDELIALKEDVAEYGAEAKKLFQSLKELSDEALSIRKQFIEGPNSLYGIAREMKKLIKSAKFDFIFYCDD